MYGGYRREPPPPPRKEEDRDALPTRVLVLLEEWFRRARENQHAHRDCGDHFSRFHLFFGVPTIVLTALAGVVALFTFQRSGMPGVQITIGLLCVLASVLAALHTFLRFAERAEKHRRSAAAYARVRRELEYLKTFPPGDTTELESRLHKISDYIDALEKESPDVPNSIREKTLEYLPPSSGSIIVPGDTPA